MTPYDKEINKAYHRGFAAAMAQLDGAYDMGDREGYERGFGHGYDLGHDIAVGNIPQPSVYIPDDDTRCPTDLEALRAEDLRFSDDVDSEARD